MLLPLKTHVEAHKQVYYTTGACIYQPRIWLRGALSPWQFPAIRSTMVIQDEMFSTMKEQVLMKTRLKSLFPLVILLLSVLLSIPPAAAERLMLRPTANGGPLQLEPAI